MIYKGLQKAHFPTEIKAARSKDVRKPNGRKEVTEKSSKLRKLNIFLDEEEILRSGTRLINAESLEYDTKCPIVLPRKDEVVEDLVRYHHEALLHGGTELTRSILREKYHIITDGVCVKKVVSGCIKCQKKRAKTGGQKMAPLPTDRLEPGIPFETAGADCFGPYTIKHGRGRATDKRWVVIFTCLKTRAIHLEVIESMSTPSFLNALIRFASRRPGLRKLYSDCGSNFKGAEAELKRAVEAWNDSATAGARVTILEWTFLPPMAHHRAGVWERLIKSVKKHINSVLDKQPVEADVLATMIAQVEAILNFRPITPVSNDPRDLEALSPAQILHPGVKLTASTSILPPAPPTSESLKYSFQKARSLVDAFWKRWVKEYITSLRDRQKWLKTEKDPKVGQIVLMVDEVKHRDAWKLGRITAVHGDDTHARTVEVWTGPGKRGTFKRDITKIVPLELDGGETEETKTEATNKQEKQRNRGEETERREERTTKDGPTDRQTANDSAASTTKRQPTNQRATNQSEAEPRGESSTATVAKERPRNDGDMEPNSTPTGTTTTKKNREVERLETHNKPGRLEKALPEKRTRR